MMQSLRLSAVVIAAVVLLAAACGSDGETSSTTTVADEQDTDAGSTDPPAASSVALDVTAVDFAGGVATITNAGDEAVELAGHWLCNRPVYVEIPAGSLAPGESLDVSIGGLSADGGEVGLYTSDSFGSSDALVDYVTWGSGGGRLSVAESAGLWSGDPATASGDTLALLGSGGSADDWSG